MLMDLAVFRFTLPYLLSALASVWIAILAFRRRGVTGGQAFGWLALAETIWTLGYIFQRFSSTLTMQLFWNNVQFLGAVTSPLAFFFFSQCYTRRETRMLPGWRVLMLVALALLGLIWSDSLHHLFRVQPHLVPSEPLPVLVFTNGPLFFLYPLIGYPLLIAGTYRIVVNYVTAPRIFRLQIATVLVGVLIPWITTVITWLDLVPLRLHDITPLTFGISNLIVGWALFRFGLFDLIPVAYATLVESMADGVLVVDGEERIIDMNLAAQKMLGLRFLPSLGMPLSAIQWPLAALLNAPQAFSSVQELELTPAGESRWVEVRFIALQDNAQTMQGKLIVLHDITEQKQAEDRLKEMALTDYLTGVYNRRHFFTLAETEFERTRRTRHPLSIILLDIDHFKTVNDTLGHAAGDRALQALARHCHKHLRPYDILARYGGEEFILLLPNTNENEAYAIADRLRMGLAQEADFNPPGLAPVTISSGIAELFTSQAETLDRLIECADSALYRAKQQGRDRACTFQNASAMDFNVRSESLQTPRE
ncbi:MAG TPA: sensor domain-containing diguanylate cyclase [Anaerolinea thermolimosa]|uniref:Protein containing PAS domain S-box and diguanylate cyclase (GGDEF) domain n=1 Tax=Anaerolinea thermolimosa TaxID=229919 RepID=A0A0M8JPA1_9CHLR|nr:histidine kinase N-terminal 7TM domain-containing protein [Anaerolinea thermolimosa]GAP08711.1 protein containing PAS domain S-box and diguanylate cyclase (GGDEF) domain [Anaerolinea thermolimosa]GAP08748.1 protein containing PAS domain S-box and diguanylate cyclase (GGDEF) domain [Anaerolinea thermolimosa]HCE16456.1 sensor domain-containing diguanylate cyclase [Anaerolinea thermolimosa]